MGLVRGEECPGILDCFRMDPGPTSRRPRQGDMRAVMPLALVFFILLQTETAVGLMRDVQSIKGLHVSPVKTSDPHELGTLQSLKGTDPREWLYEAPSDSGPDPSMQARVDELEDEVATLREDLQDAHAAQRRANFALKVKDDELAAACSAKKALQSQLEAEKVFLVRLKNDELRAQAASLGAIKTDLKNEFLLQAAKEQEEWGRKESELRAETVSLGSAIVAEREALSESNARCGELEEELGRLEEEGNVRIAQQLEELALLRKSFGQIASEKAALQRNLCDLEPEVNMLRKKLANLYEEMGEVQKDAEDLREANALMQGRLSVIDDLELSTKERMEKIDELESSKTRLTQERDSLLSRLRVLKCEKESMQEQAIEACADKEHLEGRVKELEGSLAKARREVFLLRQDCSGLKRTLADTEGKEEQLRVERESIRRATLLHEREVGSLIAAAEASKMEADSLRGELGAFKAELDVAKGKLGSSKAEHENAAIELNSAETKFSTIRNDSEASEGSSHGGDVRALEEELQSTKAELKKAKAESIATVEKLRKERDSAAALRHDRANLELKLAWKGEQAPFASYAEDMMTDMQRLRNELKHVVSEHMAVRMQVEASRPRLADTPYNQGLSDAMASMMKGLGQNLLVGTDRGHVSSISQQLYEVNQMNREGDLQSLRKFSVSTQGWPGQPQQPQAQHSVRGGRSRSWSAWLSSVSGCFGSVGDGLEYTGRFMGPRHSPRRKRNPVI